MQTHTTSCALSLDELLAAVDALSHLVTMAKFLISFPAEAMNLSDEELRAASFESRAVIEDAKAVGVYVFGGGIDEAIAPVMVGGDGSVSLQTYPGGQLTGGFAVFEVPTREEAVKWARKLAVACRCAQELRAFMYDPAS